MRKQRIMYIENKCGENDLIGEARIGRVTFSKTGKSIHYKGLTFETLSGSGFKANYFDVESGDHYWISGCKRNGEDRLYGERLPIYIDDDVRDEYWTEIRNLPKKKTLEQIQLIKYGLLGRSAKKAISLDDKKSRINKLLANYNTMLCKRHQWIF